MAGATHTRRSVLIGAGGAVAGAAAAGLGPAAALGHDPERPKPPFDIRDLVANAGADSEQIQCYYDTINRTIMLAGDVPFKTLFGGRMRRLVPTIDSRVDEAAEFGLVPDPELTHSLLGELLELGGGLTMEDLFAAHRRRVPNDLEELLLALRGQGILAPLPSPTGAVVRERRRAIRRLRRRLRNETLLGYFSNPAVDLSGRQLAAVALAKQTSLMSCGKNDKCCKTLKKTPGGSPLRQKCVPMTDKDCYIAVRPGEKLCTAASDDC